MFERGWTFFVLHLVGGFEDKRGQIIVQNDRGLQ